MEISPRRESQESDSAEELRLLSSKVDEIRKLVDGKVQPRELTDRLYEACQQKTSPLAVLAFLLVSEPEKYKDTVADAKLSDEEKSVLEKAIDEFREDEEVLSRIMQGVKPVAVARIGGTNRWEDVEAEPFLSVTTDIPFLEVSAHTNEGNLLFRTHAPVCEFTENAAALLAAISAAYESCSEKMISAYRFYKDIESESLSDALGFVMHICEALDLDFETVLDNARNRETPQS